MNGGTPSLKKHALAKIIHIKQKLNLVEIFRIRNTKTKRFIFRQQHTTEFVQRSIDDFFASNYLQETI